ncbi:MAG: hypothetical protein ABEJ99_06110 [Candidatus Nanohaloarchaea archaeon]
MWVFAFTPLSTVSNLVFQYLIVGVLFYGALLTGGFWLAKRGIRNSDHGKAYLGTGILQFEYGIFGAGLLGPRTQLYLESPQ